MKKNHLIIVSDPKTKITGLIFPKLRDHLAHLHKVLIASSHKWVDYSALVSRCQIISLRSGLINVIVVFSILLIGCNKNQPGNPEKLTYLETPDSTAYFRMNNIHWVTPLSGIEYKDTLKISAVIGDFGEWGGHEERFLIFNKNDLGLWANYYKDTLTYEEFKRGIKPVIVQDTNFKISRNDELIISDFLQDLTKMNLCQLAFSNGGSIYTVNDTDSTLYIRFYDTEMRWTGFTRMKKLLLKK